MLVPCPPRNTRTRSASSLRTLYSKNLAWASVICTWPGDCFTTAFLACTQKRTRSGDSGERITENGENSDRLAIREEAHGSQKVAGGDHTTQNLTAPNILGGAGWLTGLDWVSRADRSRWCEEASLPLRSRLPSVPCPSPSPRGLPHAYPSLRAMHAPLPSALREAGRRHGAGIGWGSGSGTPRGASGQPHNRSDGVFCMRPPLQTDIC